jgi:DNA-binding transcriptional regulator YiaG
VNERFVEIRKYLKLNQKEFSKYLNTNQLVIYKGERKTHPSFLRGWDVSDKH